MPGRFPTPQSVDFDFLIFCFAGPCPALSFRRCHDLSGRTIALDGLSLKLDDIVRVARHGDAVCLGEEAVQAVKKAAALVAR